jgi:glutathione S-transferase
MGGMVQDQHSAQFHGSDILACGAYRAEHRDAAAIGEAVGVLGNKLDIAEHQVSRHAFLAGDDFTLADIQFGHLLYRYFDIAIDRPNHPALRRYYDRLTARPAFRQHVMVSYEELRCSR